MNTELLNNANTVLRIHLSFSRFGRVGADVLIFNSVSLHYLCNNTYFLAAFVHLSKQHILNTCESVWTLVM